MFASRTRILSLALLAAASISIASPAHAQLGGLVKKAVKKAAGEAAADAAGDRGRRALPGGGGAGNPGPESVVGAELTADTLDMVLKGLAAVAERRASIRSLQTERDRASDRRSAFLDANGRTLDAYREKRNEYQDCSSRFERELHQKRQPETEKRMQELSTSPDRLKFLEEFNKVNAAAAAAQQSGDTVAMRRIQREFEKKFLGIDAVADSVAEARTCGVEPAAPKELAEQERLDAEVSKLDDRIRSAESAAEAAGPQTSGLSATRFALARERLITWVGLDRGGNAATSFPEREHQLFSTHKGDIVRLLDSSSR